VRSDSVRARKFCLIGALRRAANGDAAALNAAYNVVCAALRARGVTAYPIDWNDTPDRSRLDVLELLDDAIALARAHARA